MQKVQVESAQATTAVALEFGVELRSFEPKRVDSRAVKSEVVAVGLLVFAIVWLTQLALASLSPPFDNVDQLTWVRSLEWGCYKHPPLPTWLIWLPSQLFGATDWTSYVLGATLTLGSTWILRNLLANLRGATHASVALLAVLCVTCYNGKLWFYIHNTVLMFITVVSAALTWRAFTSRRLRWWAVLGIVLGLGALSKYQIVVTMSTVLVFMGQQKAWRDPVHRQGILLAALIVLLMFTPHVFWLRAHDFGPVGHAIDSSLGAHLDAPNRWLDSTHRLIDQIGNRLSPALLLLGAAAFVGRRRTWLAPTRRHAAPRNDASRSFLLTWGIVPLLFMPLVGIAFGVDLPKQWGAAFLLMAVPAAMEWRHAAEWNRADLGKVLAIFVVSQILLLGVSQLTSPWGPAALRGHDWRTFDSADLADTIAAAARLELGGPVRVVSGEGALAGALALQLPEHPLVLNDGRFDRSPWVSAELVRQ